MRVRTLAVGAALTAMSFTAVPLAMANATSHKPATNTHKPATNTHKPAPKTHKPAKHFTATGTVVSVDLGAGTVTLADKGGSKDLHGKTVTVLTGAKTKIVRNGAKAALSSLVA